MRKPDFCLCENKGADQLHSNCKVDQRLCFLYTNSTTLNLKFQASSHLLWLYRSVYVRPGRKPRRLVFSRRGSLNLYPKMTHCHMSHIVRKQDYCLCENKGADQLISTFLFITWTVPFLFFPTPKFQASCLFLRLYRPVCVRPVEKTHFLALQPIL